eukprot:5602227-Amphidinium_carterae.1
MAIKGGTEGRARDLIQSLEGSNDTAHSYPRHSVHPGQGAPSLPNLVSAAQEKGVADRLRSQGLALANLPRVVASSTGAV